MLEVIADWVTYSVFKLIPGSQAAAGMQFFVYDLIKIYLLILLIVTVISFIRSYLPPHRIKKVLSRQKFASGNIIAALLGAVTPFCSCSSIPLFIGFLEAEIPLGIAFSFLITSPLVNEIAFILMGGTFGWKIAWLYAFSGIVLGILGGLLIGRFKLSKEILIKFDGNGKEAKVSGKLPGSFEERIRFSVSKALGIFKRLWLVIAIGVGLGAVIHGYVPAEFFQYYLGNGSLWAVPLAVLAGVPMYSNSATIVPIVFALTTKGVSLGTALAFMMAVAGLSLPEAVMLKKVMSAKLLGIFFGSVALGIMLIGFLFNALF